MIRRRGSWKDSLTCSSKTAWTARPSWHAPPHVPGTPTYILNPSQSPRQHFNHIYSSVSSNTNQFGFWSFANQTRQDFAQCIENVFTGVPFVGGNCQHMSAANISSLVKSQTEVKVAAEIYSCTIKRRMKKPTIAWDAMYCKCAAVTLP